MKAQPNTWLYTKLEDCCARYFSWAKTACMNAGGNANSPVTLPTGNAGSAGNKVYYPDWTTNTIKCLYDGKEPDYMVKNRDAWMYSSIESCCNRYFSWDLKKCVQNSGGNTASSNSSATSSNSSAIIGGSSRWYVKWESSACVQDCPKTKSSSCGGLAEKWENITNYGTKEQCCREKLFWIPLTTCTGGSSSNSSATSSNSSAIIGGSSRWYIDWVRFKCVQDCPKTLSPSCGGLADSWAINPNYGTKEACCRDKLSWIPLANCTSSL